MKKQAQAIKWGYEIHELPGRTVTIVELRVPGDRQQARVVRGVSIRNPQDCPVPRHGIKFALTRALQRAKVSKAKRAQVWASFLELTGGK